MLDVTGILRREEQERGSHRPDALRENDISQVNKHMINPESQGTG